MSISWDFRLQSLRFLATNYFVPSARAHRPVQKRKRKHGTGCRTDAQGDAAAGETAAPRLPAARGWREQRRPDRRRATAVLAGTGLGGDSEDGPVTFAVRMLPGVAKLLRLQVATKPFKAGVWGRGATGGWVRLRPLDVTEVGTRPTGLTSETLPTRL